MFRYVTLLWDSRDRPHADTAQKLAQRLRAVSAQWREVLVGDGIRVLCADSHARSLEPHVLPNRPGVVLGALFERRSDPEDDAPSRPVAITPQCAESIIASRGRWLIERCWGDYVAFLVDPLAQRTYVIKDPSGDLPCFGAVFRDVHLFFSCVADCADLGLQFALDRTFLRARVVGAGGASLQHALEGVAQVHRGECVELDFVAAMPSKTRRFYWNPLSFTQHDTAIEDPQRAARSLRATVRGCTSTWVACHASLLHRLSGGLDSSIVAGCLSGAPTKPRIACYTYFNPHGRSDERPWARLAAQHAQIEHLECPIRPADIDLPSVLRMPPSVEPAPVMSWILRTTTEKRLAQERAATAVFCGDGGDSGFCSEAVAYAVQEYFRRRGLRPGALRLAAQVALQTQQSAWTVLARACRGQFLGAETPLRREAFLAVLRLVTPELREEFSTDLLCRHPWFCGVHPAPWPTVLRMGALLGTPDFYNVGVGASETCPVVRAPLYSQPVLELCLQIPLYTHFEHGRDRGLARRAFANEAPETIRNRLWKDRAPGFHDELVQRNREFLLETLLDGLLVAEGLLDRAAVAQALSVSAIKTAPSSVEMLRHLELELWARQWPPSAAHRAAA